MHSTECVTPNTTNLPATTPLTQHTDNDLLAGSTDSPPTLSDSQPQAQNSSSHVTFNNEAKDARPTTRPSLAARLRIFPRKTKDRFLTFLNAKYRIILVHYFTHTENQKDLLALEGILSEYSRDIEDPEVGKIIELHVPANNVNHNGTQGFWGRFDTAALGFSFVQEHVVNAAKERYIPLKNLPCKLQAHCAKIEGIIGGQLPIRGVVSLYAYHPSAPDFLFPWHYLVVPDDIAMKFDFLLGTDWLHGLQTCVSRARKRLWRGNASMAMVGIVERPKQGHDIQIGDGVMGA